jgi:hypothetical protein
MASLIRSRAARAVLIALGFGVALGFLEQSLRHSSPPLPWLTALGVPWLATAFVVGALVRGRRRAPIAAAATLVFAVITYYLVMRLTAGHTTTGYVLRVGAAWSVAAAAAGAGFGALGAAWRARARRETLATAAISGAFAGEALLLLDTWHSRAAQTVLAWELVVGMALPFVLSRRRRLARALALTAAVALALAGAEAGVREAMRSAGWAGA